MAKAIEDSPLKVTANTDGNVIRINLPSLPMKEKEYEKVVKKMTEETRIRIRGARDEANKEVKKMRKKEVVGRRGI